MVVSDVSGNLSGLSGMLVPISNTLKGSVLGENVSWL